MPRIISAYTHRTPTDAAEWEQQANAAESDTAALVQLTYHLMLQVRTLKLLLIGALVVVPGVALLIVLVLGGTGAFSDSTPY